ncbi:MAG: FtsX-like permease family protein [Acidobacteriota bacterium]
MKTPLAWRNLVHAKVRTGLALAGIAFAVMLVFLQVGLHGAMKTGATLFFDAMEHDLVVLPTDYIFLASPAVFPKRRLQQVAALPEVASVAPLFVGQSHWAVPESGARLSTVVFGIDPEAPAFPAETLGADPALLRSLDTVLADTQTRDIFGPRDVGSTIEVGDRRVKVVGESTLGTAFLDLGVLVASDRTYQHVLPGARLDRPSMGLVELRDGADAEQVLERLRLSLPPDVEVVSRATLNQRETHHWLVLTSTGPIFGSGALVAIIVGVVVIYQALATQVMRHLPEYATMKAMGYADGQVSRVVIQQSVLLAITGFVPGLLAALGLYAMLRQKDFIPIWMTPTRVIAVLVLTVAMAVVAGFLALGKVRKADPADLF